MRRTQLYLEDDIWNALHIQARQAGTSISELVRQALRDRYGNSPENRWRAMQDWAGIWQSRKDLPNSETYVRRLRKGTRLRRLASCQKPPRRTGRRADRGNRRHYPTKDVTFY